MRSIIKRSISWRNLIQRQPVEFSTVQYFTEKQLKGAEKYVEETLRSRNWLTYVFASYYPAQLRQAFYAIHMFDLELTKVSENSRQPSLALGKLQFWRNVVYKIYENEKPSPQPISICLHQACHTNPLTKGYLTRMLDVRAHEITNRHVQTFSEFRKMANESKSTLIALQLELLRIEITNQDLKDVIGYVGEAIGICEYIKRVPYSLRNNRFLLPSDILTKYNLSSNKIWDRVYGQPSEELFDVVLEIAAFAKKSFEEAVKIYQNNPKSFPEHSFRAFLKGVEIEFYFQQLQKYNFNIFNANLNSQSPFKLPYRLYNAAKEKKFYSINPPPPTPK